MGINYSNKQSPAALRHMCSRTPIRTVTTISSSTAVRRRLDLSGNCCLLFSLNLVVACSPQGTMVLPRQLADMLSGGALH